MNEEARELLRKLAGYDEEPPAPKPKPSLLASSPWLLHPPQRPPHLHAVRVRQPPVMHELTDTGINAMAEALLRLASNGEQSWERATPNYRPSSATSSGR